MKDYRFAEGPGLFSRRTFIRNSSLVAVGTIAGALVDKAGAISVDEVENMVKNGRINQSVSRWCYGRIPLDEFKLDRPDEYKELVEKGELEKYLVEQYPPIVLKGMRIFGWSALTIGFSIIVWIIYAMIFAYR